LDFSNPLFSPGRLALGIEQFSARLYFQTFRNKKPTGRAMSRSEAYRMVRRRAIEAGVSAPVSCHSFRATGITVYLENNGALETAQKIAAHESLARGSSTIRTDDQLTLDEIEKISV
jgi:integrase/recombinase XerD